VAAIEGHCGPQPVAAPRCSLVIPTKNGGALFHRVVQGLQQQDCWSEVEFVIIDSGSTDDTIAVARAAGARVISIHPETFNHGSARDQAIAQTRGPVVVLMVQDAVPGSTTLLSMLLEAFDDSEVAGVYARQVAQPDADVLTQRNLSDWLTGRSAREVRQSKGEGWYCALAPMEKFLFCNFDNVCSAIRRSSWELNKFGKVAFGEDIDWAERILRDGWKIVFEPSAFVIHSHDRPLAYEYKRTYACHRKLYKQFGLQLVPSFLAAWPAIVRASRSDALYVLKYEKSRLATIKTLLRIPALHVLSAFAQYRAAKDEARGLQVETRGV
jgi:rhamnosyltransferase